VCAPSFTDSSRCGRGLDGSTVLSTPTVGEARRRELMSELTLDDARRVASAAEGKALELGCAVTITVTDAGGHVRAQTRQDGARFGTVNVSANKAFTAAAFGAPTKILAGLTQPGQDLFGFADAAGGRIAIFPGGMPLVRDEEIVGAIGISGGSVDQDQGIADAGAAAV